MNAHTYMYVYKYTYIYVRVNMYVNTLFSFLKKKKGNIVAMAGGILCHEKCDIYARMAKRKRVIMHVCMLVYMCIHIRG